MTVVRSGSASDVGRVRTVNEDLALESLTLFAVADGMGGHVGGEIAARTAIETLQAEFGRKPSAEGLAAAIHDANKAVWERGHEDADLRGMGTTMIAAALVATDDGDRLVLANVGDSRAYRLHDDSLVQLTTDHSVAEELVARGELSEEEAAVHPHRHILTRALGVQPEVAIDVWQLVPEEGDRFLLCSDGLTNEVPPEEITDVLSRTRDPRQAAEALVRLANEAGGSDNATVVVIDVMVGEPASVEPEEAQAAESADVVVAAAPDRPASGAEASAPAGATMVVSAPEVPPSAPIPAGTITTNGAGAAVVSRSAPDIDLARPPSPRYDPRTGARIPRRITFRVLLFLVVVGGLAYAGYASIRWYVNNSYFIGLSHNQVVIYQGRPGGFVGMNPKIVKRTQVTARQVPSYKIPDLRSGVQEPSYKAAAGYVTSLVQAVCALDQPPAYCPTASLPSGATTSTTIPTSTPATFGLRPTAPAGPGHGGEVA
ncbi:MAG TPA: Stp1/IreP family PP2C-type Ser/Thr phosphatase [Acidimicrobiales bacterium]|nr:Stp1/IreP family PP2C-type Ser/Thr phosphatase [Acidimicrobiales bacterium]